MQQKNVFFFLFQRSIKLIELMIVQSGIVRLYHIRQFLPWSSIQYLTTRRTIVSSTYQSTNYILALATDNQ